MTVLSWLTALWGCGMFSDSRIFVATVVELDGRPYAYSTNAQLAATGATPSVTKNLRVYVDGAHLWVQPQDVGPTAHLLAGDVVWFDRPDATIAGYADVGDAKVEDTRFTLENTATLGEQRRTNVLELRDRAGERTHVIRWVQQPLEALENCEVKSITVASTPVPGETHYTPTAMAVVDLQTVAAFYGGSVRLEGEVLTIVPGEKPVPPAPVVPDATGGPLHPLPFTAADVIASDATAALADLTANQAALTFCTGGSKTAKIQGGDVVVELDVGRRGKVDAARGISHTTGDEAFAACVVEHLGQRPYRNSSGTIQVTVHFVR